MLELQLRCAEYVPGICEPPGLGSGEEEGVGEGGDDESEDVGDGGGGLWVLDTACPLRYTSVLASASQQQLYRTEGPRLYLVLHVQHIHHATNQLGLTPTPIYLY